MIDVRDDGEVADALRGDLEHRALLHLTRGVLLGLHDGSVAAGGGGADDAGRGVRDTRGPAG